MVEKTESYIDDIGRSILSDRDAAKALYINLGKIDDIYLIDPTQYNTAIEKTGIDVPKMPQVIDVDPVLFHASRKETWFMPDEYKAFDIAEWLVNQCTTDAQLSRLEVELIEYNDRGLFDMLRYLKYLVDTMRSNGILWGVGRGSSVASYVLFLIGVHRIDSIYHELDFKEFMR